MTTIQDVSPEQVWTLYHAAEAKGDESGRARALEALREWDRGSALAECVEAIQAAESRRTPAYEPDEDDDSDPVDHGLEHDYTE